ncbi:chromosomal passenger protein [Novymonas esmeraldas]|uniref:Chromosomal passenger protein n=1 Tax=Novymonas esmeraldas TaxID=1808958 RepID=A0AAW0ENU5_9TRYP
MEAVAWTPDVVEDLLFRQFIKDEDVSRHLPPAPQVSSENFLEKYDQATKILFSYVRNGPVSALASQNVNTAGKYGGATPLKGFVGRTPATKPVPPEPSRSFTRTATPAPAPTSRAPSAHKAPTGSPPPPVRPKRPRVEWPADVPTNQMLKSNSRSKVAHLTAKRVAAQKGVDPDLLFTQNAGDLPLSSIFAPYPKALKSVSSVRNDSGDWRTDAFTTEEEDSYKSDLGYVHCGPSQCVHGKWVPSQS